MVNKDFNQEKTKVNSRLLWEPIPPFDVGTTRQLLFDDFLISRGDRFNWDQLPYGISFQLGKVNKEKIILKTENNEEGIAWFCVQKENSQFKMWYMSGGKVRYAISNDGREWAKETVGLYEYNNSKQNNIVFDGGFNSSEGEFGNVFKDPNAHPGEEYKMVYADWHTSESSKLPEFSPTNGTLRGASSPDGLNWTRYAENFIGHYTDSQNTGHWNPTLGKYIIYHRSFARHGFLNAGSINIRGAEGDSYPGFGRAVGRMESYDFRIWSESKLALDTDIEDGLNTDIYTNSYSRHPANVNVHYMFPAMYRHYEGTFEIQVAVSRDDINWVRPSRDVFIPLGKKEEFDSYIISVSPGFVELDKDTWALYYRAGNSPHGGCKPVDLGYTPEGVGSYVTFKRDRILGIEGQKQGGHFVTRPLKFDGKQLFINAVPTSVDGSESSNDSSEILVQIVDPHTAKPLPGYTFKECQPIKEDGLDVPVKWNGNSIIGPEVSRKFIALHFKIRSMQIYSFQFA